jgi:hypothetical protein
MLAFDVQSYQAPWRNGRGESMANDVIDAEVILNRAKALGKAPLESQDT